MNSNIIIVDTGSANILSVSSAIKKIGYRAIVTTDINIVKNSKYLLMSLSSFLDS